MHSVCPAFEHLKGVTAPGGERKREKRQQRHEKDTHSKKVRAGIKNRSACAETVLHISYYLLLETVFLLYAGRLSLRAVKVVVCYITVGTVVGLAQQPFSSLKVG